MVTVLLEHIPDISKKDFLGSKAIHYAVKNGDKGAVKKGLVLSMNCQHQICNCDLESRFEIQD